MITDNYKLVPFTGSKVQLPCAVCPLDEICCAYNTYMIFNEMETPSHVMFIADLINFRYKAASRRQYK